MLLRAEDLDGWLVMFSTRCPGQASRKLLDLCQIWWGGWCILNDFSPSNFLTSPSENFLIKVNDLISIISNISFFYLHLHPNLLGRDACPSVSWVFLGSLLSNLLASFILCIDGIGGLLIGSPMLFSCGQSPISLAENFPSFKLRKLFVHDLDVP